MPHRRLRPRPMQTTRSCPQHRSAPRCHATRSSTSGCSRMATSAPTATGGAATPPTSTRSAGCATTCTLSSAGLTSSAFRGGQARRLWIRRCVALALGFTQRRPRPRDQPKLTPKASSPSTQPEKHGACTVAWPDDDADASVDQQRQALASFLGKPSAKRQKGPERQRILHEAMLEPVASF